MLWFTVIIGSHQERHETLPGQLALCPDCHQDLWHLFRIKAGKELYAQCLSCDRVELLDGKEPGQLALYAIRHPALTGIEYARQLVERGGLT